MVNYSLNKNAVVAILSDKENQIPVGTGFFISSQFVITCAHVITNNPKPPLGNVIHLRMMDGCLIESMVEESYWREANKEDIAILRLIPRRDEKVESLRFSCSEDIRDNIFETYGFPQGHPTGLAGRVSVLGLNPGPPPLLQLQSGEIVVGFSGGPIFDRTTGCVVGMTSEKVTPDVKNLDGSVIKKSASQLIVTGLREVAKATPSFVIRDVCKNCEGINFQQVCPYQGLDHFTEKQSAYFFGRDNLIGHLIATLKISHQFLSVTGTSGSGKSSVVRAKLLPHLRENGVSITDEKVSIVSIRFSSQQSLEESFLNAVYKQFNPQPSSGISLDWATLESFSPKKDGNRLVIFMDQFEEVFTLYSNEEASLFLDRLNRLLDINRSVTLILASRIEFEAKLEESAFSNRLAKGSCQVRGIPGPDLELEQIIVQPAEVVGLVVEQGLVDRIIQDLGTMKNPLPLLEVTLKKLWEIDISTSGKSSLTLKTYKEHFSSISDVLSLRANEVYEYELSKYSTKEWERKRKRSEIEQKLIRSIFGRLIKFNSQSGDGLPDTRFRVKRKELEEISGGTHTGSVDVSNLLNQMIGVGLLAFDGDESTIEIIHEILLKEWVSKLSINGENWLNNQRKFRFWQQRLAESISSWDANHRDEAYLLSDANLARAEKYHTEVCEEFSPIEQSYVQESINKREYLRQQAQKKDEELLKEKVNRETVEERNAILSRAWKIALVILGISVPAAIFAAIFAFKKSQEAILSQKASQADQVSREALRKFPSGQLDALQTAIDAAKELQEITKDIQDIKDYPTIGPITVLREILDKIQEFRHFNGNQGEIKGAVFLPGTDRFITAGEGTKEGGMLKIWSSSGDLVGELEGHEKGLISGGVKGIAIGGDQRSPLVASAGGDGAVKLWDKVKVGKPVRNLEVAGQKEKKPFTTIAVSGDGQRVAAGQSNGMIHLWERSGKLLKSWSAHGQEVTGVAFSGDGQKIVTSSDDGLARVWTLAGNKTAELKSPTVKKVMGVSFSSDGKWIATASDDRVARIWTVAGQEVKRLEGHEGWVTVANFSPDSQVVATASDDGTVKLWDMKTGQKVEDFRGHRGVVLTASFSQDGKRLISAGRDGEIRLWNLETENSKVTALPGFTDDVNAIVFSPDGKTIVGAGNEGVIRQWDLSGKALKVWQKALFKNPTHDRETKTHVQDLAFSSDGQYVLASGLSSIARVWKVDEQNTDEPFIKLKGGEDTEKAHRGDIFSIAVSPNGELIATGSVDKTMRIWKKTSPYGELVAVTSEREGVVSRVVFTSDGQKIISADWDGTVTIWNLDGKQIQQFEHVHPTQIRGLAVTREGSRIVTADKMGDIKILDASGKILKEFKSYQIGINELTISPDGQLIATAGMDKTARVWDFQGRQVAEFYNPKGAVWGVAFSPDSQSIAFSGDKGFAIVRSIDTLDDLLKKGCLWFGWQKESKDCT